MTEKLAIINVADYPADRYAVHWEYFTHDEGDGTWSWLCRLYDNRSHVILDTANGIDPSENDARRAAQQFVLDNIEQYRIEL